MEIRNNKPLSSLWYKAAVVGSLWASVEIILGSFFHNLNLPLSGTILSFITVYLLISFSQIWSEQGLLWRSGLICALMKSISPSAIILGPMIGIFTEALLLEIFILFFGKNLFGYMIGGAFAVLSTILHKLVSLTITYGFDFITILGALYKFCVKQLHFEFMTPGYLILFIVLVYVAAGMTAAILGYTTGMKYKQIRMDGAVRSDLTLDPGKRIFAPVREHKFSILFLVLNLTMIILCLVLVNNDYPLPSVILALLFLTFCFYRYKTALRRLKKISVWVQFFLITMIASLLWTGISESEILSMTGFVTGLKMNYRAILIIVGFAAISVELRNPVIKAILYRRGGSGLYQSLGLAFSALPGILSSFPEESQKSKRRKVSITGLLHKAEGLLNLFEEEHSVRPDIAILTGDIRGGKTTMAKNVADRLIAKGKRVHGFLSVGVHENGDRTGFDLHDLENGRRFELCRTTNNPEWQKQGIFYFNPDGLTAGRSILSSFDPGTSDLLVIDEIGPLEVHDQGWAEEIARLCRFRVPLHLWIVRRNLVELISRKWNVGTVYIFDIGKETAEEITERLEAIIRENVRTRTDNPGNPLDN
jgi:nucleoside-triphosphatase THEP1